MMAIFKPVQTQDIVNPETSESEDKKYQNEKIRMKGPGKSVSESRELHQRVKRVKSWE